MEGIEIIRKRSRVETVYEAISGPDSTQWFPLTNQIVLKKTTTHISISRSLKLVRKCDKVIYFSFAFEKLMQFKSLTHITVGEVSDEAAH